MRLRKIGYDVGLISREKYDKFLDKKDMIEKEIERIKSTVIKPNSKVNEVLKSLGSSEITTGVKLSDLLKRSELNYENLKEIDTKRVELPESVKEETEIEIKYEGYIKLQLQQVENFKKLEKKLLPEDINYEDIKGLRIEARQKLNKIRPTSIGQASRISGVSPADISVLLIFMEQFNRKKEN